MSRAEDLLPLLSEPSESLAVEHKSWMDLSGTPNKARLAKAVIAMANHGGGTIIIGMRESLANGGELISQPRPIDCPRYSVDAVNAAVKRFADPAVHCDVTHLKHPTTGHEHAIISVPADTSVPVLSKRLCDGVINQARAYIRKPGPISEEANTPAEWAALLDRCLQVRRADMLDAIRNIVLGQVSAQGAPAVEGDPFLEFLDGSNQRWLNLISPLPKEVGARFPFGAYEFGFALYGEIEPIPVRRLVQMIETAHRIRLTGWPTFLIIDRTPYEPSVVGNGVETWLGRPDTIDQFPSFSDAARSDFWRIDQDGRLFMKRGYQEDGLAKFEPGTAFDITLPIWRLGEALLFVERFARQIDGCEGVSVRVRYTGLEGRQLVSVNWDRNVSPGYVCRDDEVTVHGTTTLDAIQDNLVEVLQPLLSPLYERFSLFPISRELVSVELEKLTRGRF